MLKNLIRKNKYLYTALKFKIILREARKNHSHYEYDNDILFIAGLPKSGTTWLESMLSEFPGYKKNMLPEATRFEQRNEGSHFLELEREWLEQLDDSLTVLKLHNWGSENNASVLKELGIPYVVLFRDLRDVAVSYYFYVKKTWHHPEYEAYKDLNTEEGLTYFADILLSSYKKWIKSWQKNHDPATSLLLRYEDLNNDTIGEFTKVAELFGLPSDSETIAEIVQNNNFETLSGGRKEGEENKSSFLRKGTSGDWHNHFTPSIKDKFKEVVGDQLIELGYEEDYNW